MALQEYQKALARQYISSKCIAAMDDYQYEG